MLLLIIAALWSPTGSVVTFSRSLVLTCHGAFWLGHIIAVVARAQLGPGWGIGVRPRSGTPIQTGLYRALPHPIYFGTQIALAAQLALLQNLAAAGLFLGGLAVVLVKARAETNMLSGAAGAGPLIARGLRSRPGRFRLAVAGVGAGALLVVVLGAAYHSATESVVAYLAQPGADLWVAPAGNDNFIRSSALLPADLADSVRAVPGVRAVDPIVRAFVVAKSSRAADARRFTLYGIGYRAPAGLGGPPAFASGRAPLGRKEVALDRAAAHRLGARLGDTIWIAGRAAAVVGLTAGTNLLVTQFVFGNLATTAAASGFGSRASFLIVSAAPGADVPALALALETRFPDFEVFDGATFVANTQREAGAGYVPLFVLVNLVGISAAALLVALLVHGIMEERKTDLAVLLALGIEASALTRALVAHAARLVLAGGAVGVLGALALAAVLDRFNPVIPLSIGGRQVVLVLGLFGLAGIAAAWLPVLRLRHIDPLEAFRP